MLGMINFHRVLFNLMFFLLTSAALPGLQPSTILFDCITLWLTNILAPFGDTPDREEALALGEEIGRFLGHTGQQVLTRIMGLILLALAAEFLVTGIKGAFNMGS